MLREPKCDPACEAGLETCLLSYSVISPFHTSQKNVARNEGGKELRCSGESREKDSVVSFKSFSKER